MKKYFILAIFTIPLVAIAATDPVNNLLANFMNILLALVKLMLPMAVLLFFWQLIKFIRDSNSGATTLAKSKDMMIYSGIILFVMVGIWTIVGYVQQSLSQNGANISSSDIRTTPAIPRDLPLR